MKKQVLITILFAMLMSMPMFAYDFQKDGIYYNIDGGNAIGDDAGNNLAFAGCRLGGGEVMPKGRNLTRLLINSSFQLVFA